MIPRDGGRPSTSSQSQASNTKKRKKKEKCLRIAILRIDSYSLQIREKVENCIVFWIIFVIIVILLVLTKRISDWEYLLIFQTFRGKLVGFKENGENCELSQI